MRLLVVGALLAAGAAFQPGTLQSGYARPALPARRATPQLAPATGARSLLRMQTNVARESGSTATFSPAALAADLYQCPQCGSSITLDDASCGACGAPVERREAFVDLTPESTAKKARNNNDFLAQATRNPFLTVALSQLGAQLSGQVSSSFRARCAATRALTKP